MKESTIHEKNMGHIKNKNIALYENNNAEDMKAELLKYLSTITEAKNLENLSLVYLKCLKREGMKSSFENIFVQNDQCLMQLDSKSWVWFKKLIYRNFQFYRFW